MIDPRYWYRIEAWETVDGDTLDLTLDLGLRVTFKGRFRLCGIDAPEVRGATAEAGRRAEEYLQAILKGRLLLAHTHRDRTEKYGRFLVDIWDADTRENINDLMVTAGHAVAYTGGTK